MSISMNPASIKPHGSFSDAVVAAPHAVASPDAFKVALYGSDGVQLGWLGENGSEWAILVSDPNKALTLESYPYGGVMYYRIRGTSRYMSVSNNAYVGFYNWIGARGWTRNGTRLISDYNHQAMSLYSKDNGYIYAWDEYSVLDVRFVG